MISSSLRTTGLLALALAVSGGLAACGGGSTAAAPSATPSASAPASAAPPAQASDAAVPGSAAPVTPAGPAATTPASPAPSTPSAPPKGAVPAGAGDCPSLALVKATLGVDVGAPAANGDAAGVVVCSYPRGANPSAVIVRIQEDQTAAGFAAAKAGFAKSGQKTVDVPDMFDGAYRSQLGSTTYGVTRTLVVLRGSTEVLVTAPTSFDGLTKLTHTMLD